MGSLLQALIQEPSRRETQPGTQLPENFKKLMEILTSKGWKNTDQATLFSGARILVIGQGTFIEHWDHLDKLEITSVPTELQIRGKASIDTIYAVCPYINLPENKTPLALIENK